MEPITLTGLCTLAQICSQMSLASGIQLSVAVEEPGNEAMSDVMISRR